MHKRWDYYEDGMDCLVAQAHKRVEQYQDERMAILEYREAEMYRAQEMILSMIPKD